MPSIPTTIPTVIPIATYPGQSDSHGQGQGNYGQGPPFPQGQGPQQGQGSPFPQGQGQGSQQGQGPPFPQGQTSDHSQGQGQGPVETPERPGSSASTKSSQHSKDKCCDPIELDIKIDIDPVIKVTVNKFSVCVVYTCDH